MDVTDFNGRTWLDQSGNFVDENEHVVERFTMTGRDTIVYEARVDDPTMYSRPWTLRRSSAASAQGTELIEYDCIEGERSETHYPGAAKQKHWVRSCSGGFVHSGDWPVPATKRRNGSPWRLDG